jgi:F0F1-type ATP synthase alpha subunit
MGKKVYKFLEQGSEDVYSTNIQVILFTLLWIGVLDDEKIQDYRTKAQVLYDKDNTFKNKIDELINSSGDFNNLLGRVSASYKDLIDYIEEGSA